jgi:two-component system, OmpR family, alkaline phosphatase synthesis response regulator PhoP
VLKALIYSVSDPNVDLYKKSLSKLDLTVTHVRSYAEFESYLLTLPVALVILDLELDDTDAITVIKEIKLRELESLPMLIVCSAKADDFIEVSAFNSGADAFIGLPIHSLLLEMKIKMLLKRVGENARETQNGSIHIDHDRYKVVIGGHAYSLPRLEFRMVSLLLSDPNKIFSKEEIASEIWKNKDVSLRRTIDIHIRNIRRELGNDIIKTYRGLGYCIRTE